MREMCGTADLTDEEKEFYEHVEEAWRTKDLSEKELKFDK